MSSFSIRNTTNQEILNELNYGLKTATTVITRYRNSEDLLLDDFNTIHYYVYDGAAVFDYSISTLMVENAVYEVTFSVSGGDDSNNDMRLIPDFDVASQFYCVYNTSDNSEIGNPVVIQQSNVVSDAFLFDMFPGSKGYDPCGKMTIFNDRTAKKLKVEVTDTSSCVTGLGYWLDDSTNSENFSPDSTNPPSYNTQSVWSKIGTLHFGIPNYSKWRIRVSRVG